MSQNPSPTKKGKKAEVEFQLREINQLTKQAEKFNDIFNDEIMSLKNTIARSKEREERIKKRIDEEVESSAKRQEEVEELVTEIRKIFDRNFKRLGHHYKEELKSVREKNRSEVEKWRRMNQELSDDAKRWKGKYESVQENYDKLRNQHTKDDGKNCPEAHDSKDVSNYKFELKMFTIEIHSLKRKLETKSSEVATLHANKKENEELISELNKKLTAESDIVKKLTHKIELDRSELEEKKDELEKKSNELKRIKSELEVNERNNGDNRKELEAAREDEKKWKAKSDIMGERVVSLMKEVEEVKRWNASLTINVERLEVEKAWVQKNFDKLKKIVDDLNNELDMYHKNISEVASSKNELVKEKGNWNSEIGTLRKDLKKAHDVIQKLNENQDELASLLSCKTNEIKKEKSEINDLKGMLKEEQLQYKKLEEALEEYQRSDNNIDLLRKELIALKEETSIHITEKCVLNEKYKSAEEKVKDLRRRLHDAEVRYKECEQKLETQKKVYEEQDAQQMKLIGFLHEQNSQNEKKNKPFFTINSKIVGEEGSKALRAEQDKNRRLNDELDGLKKDYDKTLKEVRQLKCQLVELHNTRDQAMFSQMPCKFSHNFDIVQIEHSLFRKCFKCGKKLHKSARKCRSCGIMSHVDCKIETGTCGVVTQGFQPSFSETTPINSDGSATSGSPQNEHYTRASAPNHSETEEDEYDLLVYDKLIQIEEQFYIDNNISPPKRKCSKPSKNAKRN